MRPYHPPSTWLVVWPGRLPSWATAESESADWASIVVRAVQPPSTVNIRTREAMVSSLVTWEPRASRPEGRASRLDGHGYGRCHASTALSPELEQLDLHRGRSTPPHDALVLSSEPSAAAPSSPPANAPHARATDSLCRPKDDGTGKSTKGGWSLQDTYTVPMGNTVASTKSEWSMSLKRRLPRGIDIGQ